MAAIVQGRNNKGLDYDVEIRVTPLSKPISSALIGWLVNGYPSLTCWSTDISLGTAFRKSGGPEPGQWQGPGKGRVGLRVLRGY